MKIRTAVLEDAQAVAAIYAPYVRDTAITFEYDAPDAAQYEERIRNIIKDFPFLVAEKDGAVIGYAYAGRVRTRAAYQHCVETSVYISRALRRSGAGKLLYEELEKLLLRQNIYVLYACITSTERTDDPYLNDDSIRFHQKMGYTTVGAFHQCGYKFGRWYDVTWMEKSLAARPDDPPPFLPFSEG